MNKQGVVALFATILFLEVSTTVLKKLDSKTADKSPRDLVDQVKEQLDDLRAIVEGSIIEAHLNIDDLITQAAIRRENLYSETEITLDQDFDIVWAQLDEIKRLSNAAGANITLCLQWRKNVIINLPGRCRSDLDKCLLPHNREIERVQTDYNYKVDILYNQVEAFDFQIDRCGGEILCLSPIITQIETAMVQIPQKVGVLVDEAVELVETVNVPIGDCMQEAIAYMTSIGAMIINDIGKCANDAIDAAESQLVI